MVLGGTLKLEQLKLVSQLSQQTKVHTTDRGALRLIRARVFIFPGTSSSYYKYLLCSLSCAASSAPTQIMRFMRESHKSTQAISEMRSSWYTINRDIIQYVSHSSTTFTLSCGSFPRTVQWLIPNWRRVDNIIIQSL